MSYASSVDIRRKVAALIAPPKRIKPSDFASKNVYSKTNTGGYKRWDPKLTPYMVEPLNEIISREKDASIFVGPARTGKSQALIDCALAYGVGCQRIDQLLVHITEKKANQFSKKRFEPMLKNSPVLRDEMTGASHDNNLSEKFFKSGHSTRIAHPSINETAASEYMRVFITDYDRIRDDIGGEGSLFIRAKKRTETFMSRGFTVVESSPSGEIQDPQWSVSLEAPHEAPPALGIMSLYNLGNRQRLYWRCPHCREYFMSPAGYEGFLFDEKEDLAGNTDPSQMGEVKLICTANGCEIDASYKYQMNLTAIWVVEGCRVEREGKAYGLAGVPRESKFASRWLTGHHAAFQSWDNLVREYLSAKREYEITGSEEALKTVHNTDMGVSYLPKRFESVASAADYQARAEPLGKKVVPKGVRFLIATVDVQGNRFIVQVVGFGIGLEWWVIDRYEIFISERLADDQPLQLDPAGYEKDWDLITKYVIKKSYPLDDGSGREMAVFVTGCDAYGRDGVTERAYNFWRKVKASGLASRFMLIKGEQVRPNVKKPRVTKSYPDNTKRSDRKASAAGDIPVWLLNSTMLKDSVAAALRCTDHGPRYLHFPAWLGDTFYEELLAEIRTDKGWDQLPGKRNETFDLLYYALGVVQAILVDNKMQEIDWEHPPVWAAEWDRNSQIDKIVEEIEQTTINRPARRMLSRGINR